MSKYEEQNPRNQLQKNDPIVEFIHKFTENMKSIKESFEKDENDEYDEFYSRINFYFSNIVTQVKLIDFEKTKVFAEKETDYKIKIAQLENKLISLENEQKMQERFYLEKIEFLEKEILKNNKFPKKIQNCNLKLKKFEKLKEENENDILKLLLENLVLKTELETQEVSKFIEIEEFLDVSSNYKPSKSDLTSVANKNRTASTEKALVNQINSTSLKSRNRPVKGVYLNEIQANTYDNNYMLKLKQTEHKIKLNPNNINKTVSSSQAYKSTTVLENNRKHTHSYSDLKESNFRAQTEMKQKDIKLKERPSSKNKLSSCNNTAKSFSTSQKQKQNAKPTSFDKHKKLGEINKLTYLSKIKSNYDKKLNGKTFSIDLAGKKVNEIQNNTKVFEPSRNKGNGIRAHNSDLKELINSQILKKNCEIRRKLNKK